MRITHDHPESRHGRPVVLDDAGGLLDGREGLKRFRRLYGLSVADMGELCGVSPRTVENWASRHDVPLYALIVMSERLRHDATV